ncbi:MAG: hypothetical protein ACTHJT_10085 [Cytophaga sp.]|uniref:hypothetical protein n=1 Tax=Cytophaga sp. TaxID=29535 RepID=UPI003F81E4D6
MSIFQTISEEEKTSLLNYPVYITLLAANKDGLLDEEEKKAAVDLYHAKKSVCEPLLKEFYSEQDEIFEKRLVEIDAALPEGRHEREAVIQTELTFISKILAKLDEKYVHALRQSMEAFIDHVSKAHRSTLVNLIFPIPITGLSD